MSLTIDCLDRSRFKGEKDSLVLFAWEPERLDAEGWLDARKEKGLEEIAQRENFKGKPAEILIHYPEKGEPVTRLVVAGLGRKKEAKADSFRDAVAAAIKASLKQTDAIWVDIPRWPEKISLTILAQAAAEGAILASYRYAKHKSSDADKKDILKKVTLVVEKPEEVEAVKTGIKKGQILAEAVNFTRDLVNEPPSRKRPLDLAKTAKSLGSKQISVRIYTKAELQKMGMNAVLGVNAGSVNEPVFVHAVYKPKNNPKKKIGLVGKGITFDSGGLNIKTPYNHMLTMKMDMAGGATVLACLKAAEKLELPVEVQAFAPFTENMPGNNAYKPGDVIQAYNGKTIEILNTDAEGRVVLADALAFASKQKLDAIVDVATLTGAVLVALGDKITGLLANNEKLAQELIAASKISGEKIWQLPLAQEYKDRIRGKVGDWANISTRGATEPGTIIGGLFLEEFVDSAPWAHLDVAGTAWTDTDIPTCPPGGTGAIVRTLLEYLSNAN
ncbi:MAG: leucyl aminopeptidase [Elusimicrobia bacterium]|nr:leucyl aminopeptidase [Elusimicrobiota bacterium]